MAWFTLQLRMQVILTSERGMMVYANAEGRPVMDMMARLPSSIWTGPVVDEMATLAP